MKKFFLKSAIILAVCVFGVALFRTFYYIPSDEIPLPEENVSLDANGERPVGISIPKIGVDAKIQEVGITKKGNMATPSNFMDVGWYKFGTVPGSMGSAVMAGHVNNELGLSAVFGKLGDLTEGDDIYVTMEKDKKLHFQVIKIKTYAFDAPGEEVFNENDAKLLKLITCTGNWIDKIKTHNKRLVVSAILVE
jgi:LPXTG-site transpeptidase (sortase) family protein